MPRRLDLPDPFGPQETTDTHEADRRNFYKVEVWTENDQIEALLYAGNRLDRARQIFADETKRWPAERFTIRQRARVLMKWPAV